MKKLGFGLMRLPTTDPNDGGSVDIELSSKMTDEFISRGFTYFDTAWMYCGGKSEEKTNEFLVSRYPRDKFTLTSKLPAYMIKSKEDRDKIFNEQLRRTGAGYFDYYLIHDVNDNTIKTFEEFDCFSWIIEKKKQGLVKNIGFSFHSGPELLEKVITEHPEMEYVQLQINYLDWESLSVQSRKCHEVAVKYDKKIIIMEPVKGGALAKVPYAVEAMFKKENPDLSVPSWAIRFAAGLENVVMVLSGMSNMEQLCDNLSYMEDFTPLSEREIELCHKAAEIINADISIPCTGCSYCVVDCPQNIAIPQYFSLYNADVNEEKAGKKGWTSQMGYYDTLSENFGRASECIECGNCENMCPQHLEIRKYLKDVSERFE